jgi:MFS family permease
VLFRFSLYGFLKNQRYFEPFLVLAILDRGLSYTELGLLVAIREACQQLLEIPSGAVADRLGRRRAMVTAFAAYVAAYLVLFVAEGFGSFAVGLALIGFADAFRTGTHKAIIFDWLDRHGRSDDRVEVYGYTRSWSQIGSAVSIPIAAAIVFVSGRYAPVFWVSAIPAAVDLVNLATYPSELDGDRQPSSLGDIARHLWDSLRRCVRDLELRRLLVEGMTFEGLYKSTKDYLQPAVAALALSLPMLAVLDEQRAVAVVAGGVYVVLHVLGAIASRRAHRWVARFGDPARAGRGAWWMLATAFVVMGVGLWLGMLAAAIAAFVAVGLLHNLFRPILVSRVDALGERKSAATVLSIESQATSTAAMLLAPLLGVLVDTARATGHPAESALWPVAAVGVLASSLILTLLRPPKQSSRP